MIGQELVRPALPPYDLLDAEHERDRRRTVVEWIISSVCNYACSYCPEELHDGRVRWPDHDTALRFCRRVSDHYRGRDLTFLFTGGEPTLYPRFIDLAAQLRAWDAAVAVLSNGSRPLSWWRRSVAHLDEVILTYHYESADPRRFTALIEFLSPRLPVQVNFLILPERLEECRAMAADLRDRFPETSVHLKPMMDHWKRVRGYDEQTRALLRASNNVAAGSPHYERGTVLKGDLAITGGGVRMVVTPIELLLADENHWASWRCAIGVETLLVRFTDVYRAACRVGGRIGSIDDEDLIFPDAPVTCDQHSCGCIGGIKATKWRGELDVRVPLPLAPRQAPHGDRARST